MQDLPTGVRTDIEGLADAYLTAPTSDALAVRTIRRDARLAERAARGLLAIGEDRPDVFAQPMFEGAPVGDPLPYEIPADLSPEEANERFAVPGYLDFTEPTGPGRAAYLHWSARERAFRDEVLARSDINVLQALWGGLSGAVTDPLGAPLIFAPELMGVRGAVEGAMAARSATGALRAGRMANAGRAAAGGAAEGLASGALYETANYGLRRYAGEDDYTLGQASANLVIGAVLGGALGGALGLLRRGEAAAHAARLPEPVAALDVDSRAAAVVLAAQDVIDDQPVRVGSIIEAQTARAAPDDAALAALDETGDAGRIPLRELDEAVAVTTRGTEIEVRYALAELEDLVTSHTDDLQRESAFPPELQPRDRGRTGAIARNKQLEAELNPKRLLRESGAESGAPIISQAGEVESGNGRAIALRRSARTGSEAYKRYRAELEAQGLDLSGFERPVLVRVRSKAMSGRDRRALAMEMNADVTERLSPAEQAMGDAAALDAATLEGIGEGAEGARRLSRAFLQRVAGDQINSLVDEAGHLSQAGRVRLDAALVAKAYGDQRLVEAVFEATDSNIKALGKALTGAAPGWARMRSLIARGEVPAEYDLTANLRSAVDLIRWARAEGKKVHEVIADRLDQTEMFTSSPGGSAISPGTEALLRLFFRDADFRLPRAADKVAGGLADYARMASEVTPGPNLFGDVPDAGSAVQIIKTLNERFAAAEASGDHVEGLFGPVETGERRPGGIRPGGGEGAGPAGQAGSGVAGSATVRKDYTLEPSAARVSPAPDEVAVTFSKLDGKPTPEARALADKLAGSTPAGFNVDIWYQAGNKSLPRATVRRPGAPRESWITVEPETADEVVQMLQAAAEVKGGVAEATPSTTPSARFPSPEPGPAAPGGGTGRAAALIAGDDELKALAADTEAFAAFVGDESPALPAEDPETIAEAIRAAAFCLKEGG